MSEAPHPPKSGDLRQGARYVVQRVALIVMFAAILFAAAGTLHWLRGWVACLYMLLLEAGTLAILARRAPETLNQRGASHTGVKAFEKVFVVVWLVISLVTPVLAGFDVIRFGWSSMSALWFFVGAALLLAVYPFATWAMIENEHFEQFVRIQTDRTHRVVSTGPYRFVRHPGYAGTILGALSLPLMLGSWWTFAPVAANIVLFVVRTALEDRTLRRELEGYEVYAKRTRYRLFPGIW
jgi:protein-S-isoprenylcysteine O-methyltransferase Ste14